MNSRIFCGTIRTPIESFNKSQSNESGIKLFKIKLFNYYNQVSLLENYLTSDELQRAERYHFEKDRNRFIICRTMLKLLLAEHIGVGLDKILINSQHNKKPILESYPSVFFNVSHTDDYGVIIIGSTIVGVDVEKVDLSNDYYETISHIFGETEINQLTTTADKTSLFFKFWTRKEAVVKATGKGIDDDFVKIPATDGMHLINSELLGNVPNLLVLSFDLDEQYLASVAFIGNPKIDKQLYFSPLPLI